MVNLGVTILMSFAILYPISDAIDINPFSPSIMMSLGIAVVCFSSFFFSSSLLLLLLLLSFSSLLFSLSLLSLSSLSLLSPLSLSSLSLSPLFLVFLFVFWVWTNGLLVFWLQSVYAQPISRSGSRNEDFGEGKREGKRKKETSADCARGKRHARSSSWCFAIGNEQQKETEILKKNATCEKICYFF